MQNLKSARINFIYLRCFLFGFWTLVVLLFKVAVDEAIEAIEAALAAAAAAILDASKVTHTTRTKMAGTKKMKQKKSNVRRCYMQKQIKKALLLLTGSEVW